jgi:transposase
LVAGLRHDAIVAPFVIDGPMNGRVFLPYVERCLAPTLGRGDIVIMDNLPTHKIAGVTKAIEAADAMAIFCLRILRISTQSNKSSANSRHCCARPQNGQFLPCGEESARSCVRSARRNV